MILRGARSFVGAVLSDRLATLGAIVILAFAFAAIFASQLAPYDPTTINRDPVTGRVEILQPPSARHLFGTTNLGRDIFSEVLFGARVALVVGMAAAALVVFVGVNVGLMSGYFGGRTDNVLMRLVDVAYAIPFEPFVVVLVALVSPSLGSLILAMGLLFWRSSARVVRAQVLSLAARPFVKAARVAGASDLRIIYLHIAPNILPIALVYVPITVAAAIIAEASVGFLGFGDPRLPTWGKTLQTAFTSGTVSEAWWWTLAPGLSIVLLVLSTFFVSRAVEKLANPALQL